MVMAAGFAISLMRSSLRSRLCGGGGCRERQDHQVQGQGPYHSRNVSGGLQKHGHESQCDRRASEREEPVGLAKGRQNILLQQISKKLIVV